MMVPNRGGTDVNRLSARSIVVLTIIVVSIHGARAPAGAERSGPYSNASLSGTFVFRTSGSSLFTSPNDLTSVPVYLASIGLVSFDGQGLLRGSVANSATRTEVVPAGRYVTP